MAEPLFRRDPSYTQTLKPLGPINHLPVEILNIFFFFCGWRTLMNSEAVCKTWQKLILKSSKWKTIRERIFPKEIKLIHPYNENLDIKDNIKGKLVNLPLGEFTQYIKSYIGLKKFITITPVMQWNEEWNLDLSKLKNPNYQDIKIQIDKLSEVFQFPNPVITVDCFRRYIIEIKQLDLSQGKLVVIVPATTYTHDYRICLSFDTKFHDDEMPVTSFKWLSLDPSDFLGKIITCSLIIIEKEKDSNDIYIYGDEKNIKDVSKSIPKLRNIKQKQWIKKYSDIPQFIERNLKALDVIKEDHLTPPFPLPGEVCQTIFSLLKKGTLISCELVAKNWRKQALVSDKWYNLKEKIFPTGCHLSYPYNNWWHVKNNIKKAYDQMNLGKFTSLVKNSKVLRKFILNTPLLQWHKPWNIDFEKFEQQNNGKIQAEYISSVFDFNIPLITMKDNTLIVIVTDLTETHEYKIFACFDLRSYDDEIDSSFLIEVVETLTDHVVLGKFITCSLFIMEREKDCEEVFIYENAVHFIDSFPKLSQINSKQLIKDLSDIAQFIENNLALLGLIKTKS